MHFCDIYKKKKKKKQKTREKAKKQSQFLKVHISKTPGAIYLKCYVVTLASIFTPKIVLLC